MIDENKLIEEIEKIDLHGRMREYAGLCAAVNIIKNQPKVGEWIPCSERVPDKPKFEKGYIIQSEIIEEPYSAYWNGEKWTDADNRELSDIVAWMPLPEPYKGE